MELIDSEFNDKRIYAKHRCEEIMCDKEPYGIPRLGPKMQYVHCSPMI